MRAFKTIKFETLQAYFIVQQVAKEYIEVKILTLIT
jgi:hypothetical protein